MIADADVARVLENVETRLAGERRHPASTYRLQFNQDFTFRDAANLVAYLHDLGITDVYASPYLKSRPGSPHGYDITDHNCLNPELGSIKDYRNFVRQLHQRDMGQILDFVPNHMSIFGNPWWTDVLENGPSSAYSRFFDIDWHPHGAGLRDRILLPILEDRYGEVLDGGGLRLLFDDGAFAIGYGTIRLPIDPGTLSPVLEACVSRLEPGPGVVHDDFLKMQDLLGTCLRLPSRSETSSDRISKRHREKTVIRRRLGQLYAKSAPVRQCIDETLAAFNGVKGQSNTFDRLHDLLESQAYRLSYWRAGSDEINYRRFFDINNLVALRQEDERVFEATHRLLRTLLADGLVNGVRIDHVDGLLDPQTYLFRLQEAYIEDRCWREAKQALGLSDEERLGWEKALQKQLSEKRQAGVLRTIERPLQVVVEKILTAKESLSESWPVDGTTGPEFAIVLNGLFINKRNGRALRSIYQWFTGNEEDFKDVACRCKKLILGTSMAADLAMLVHQLQKISERSRNYRDFTFNSLKEAVAEVIASFPVYRTYIQVNSGTVDEQDKDNINTAVAEAKRRNPAVSSSIFDFVRDMLLLAHPQGLPAAARKEQEAFVMRFQQLTGPIMAKGVEDTAFYIYGALTSLNDVGGNPARFGNRLDEFHLQNIRRKKRWPHSLICTSTHDSKRSEDVRARLNVLSEVPQEWRAALVRWRRLNGKKKSVVHGNSVPDRNEEYLMYQTLLGTFPAQEETNPKDLEDYSRRIGEYVLKAIREAKVHTSWISPDIDYEKGVSDFVTNLLAPGANPFLEDFIQLNEVVARCGRYNSLAQVVLKICSPGTPDIYQGSELWNPALVDPDNRRPVNFSRRVRMLRGLKKQLAAQGRSRLALRLMSRMTDGTIKMYVTSTALAYRSAHADLFNQASYLPIGGAGPKAGHVCSFAWVKRNQAMLVVVPRLVARLTRLGAVAPLGADVWGDTVLEVPGRCGISFRNIFTGEILDRVNARGRRSTLSLAEAFATFPVAVFDRV